MRQLRSILCLAALLGALLLPGCQSQGDAAPQRGLPDLEASQSADPEAARTAPAGAALDFLEAIAPGAQVTLPRGENNFSGELEALWQEYGEAWNREHDYVQLEERYDGVGILIQNVENLTLTGETEDPRDTSLLMDPRYVSVLDFDNCKRLTVKNLTLGHTEGAECAGDVICLSRCTNVELENLELFGCGVVGLRVWEQSGGITLRDSLIYGCSDGPVSFMEGIGGLEIVDCVLRDNQGGGYYLPTEDSSLIFNRCTFGPEETNTWAFDWNAVTVDCSWSEATEYPDYSDPDFYGGNWDDPQAPEPETPAYSHLDPVPFDAKVLSGTYWVGCQMTQTDLNLSHPLPYYDPWSETLTSITAELREDGTGTLSGYGDAPLEFTWAMDGDYSATLTIDDEVYSQCLTLHAIPGADSSALWMLLSLGSMSIWLC